MFVQSVSYWLYSGCMIIYLVTGTFMSNDVNIYIVRSYRIVTEVTNSVTRWDIKAKIIVM